VATESDRQRRRQRQNRLALGIVALGVVGLVSLLGYGVYKSEAADAQNRQAEQMQKPNEYNCTSSPVKVKLPGVEEVPCKTANHVAVGTKITYESDPPLSGQHYPTWVNPGFYAVPQQAGQLVHSLEHGNVVIYYDKARLSESELGVIRQLAEQYRDPWQGVVAVPRADGTNALILTAWEHGLRLAAFDQIRVNTFVDAFRGRGPEQPVRP
jgi:hypothetical protein